LGLKARGEGYIVGEREYEEGATRRKPGGAITAPEGD